MRKGGGRRNNSRPMDDAKRVMPRMVEIFATGNLDTLDSVVSTDYVDHQGLGDLERAQKVFAA
jgi:hypothetical protein